MVNPNNNPLERLFRQFDGDNDDDGFFSPFLASSSSYTGSSHGMNIHQDEKEVTVEVDVPGVSPDDLKLEVWQPTHHSCMIQWSGQRRLGERHRQTGGSSQPQTISNRVRLGPQVDCDRIAANLSRGILSLTAPFKEPQSTSEPTTRSIPIKEVP
jgi:HSP20 family molecular chaperone IbpA